MKQTKHDVDLKGRIGYGFCNAGVNIVQTIVGSFVTMYYTDNVMLSAAFVGSMMMVARILDGVSDLAMGAIVDRTHTRLGKARPWVLIGAVLFSLSMFFVFNVPAGITGTAAKLYCSFMYVMNTVICGTIVNVSWSALAVKMSRNPDTRAGMVSIAQFFAQFAGLVAGSYAIPVIMVFGGYEKGYRGMTIVFGIVALVSMLLTGILCKEYEVEEKDEAEAKALKPEKKQSAKELLGYMFQNKYTVPLIIAFVVNWFATMLFSSATIYYARDIMGNGDFMKILNNARSLPAMFLLVIGVVPLFATKFGKRKALVFAFISHLVSGVILFVAGQNLILLVLGQVLRSVGSAFGSTMLMAMVSDTADYINLKNNIDISGMTSSIVSFGMKVGMGLGSAVLAWTLAWGGYSGEAAKNGLAQSASTMLAEKACFIYIPTACFLLLLFICNTLDVDKKVKELRASLEAKTNA